MVILGPVRVLMLELANLHSLGPVANLEPLGPFGHFRIVYRRCFVELCRLYVMRRLLALCGQRTKYILFGLDDLVSVRVVMVHE